MEGLREEFGASRIAFEALDDMEFSAEDIQRVVQAIEGSNPELQCCFWGKCPTPRFSETLVIASS